MLPAKKALIGFIKVPTIYVKNIYSDKYKYIFESNYNNKTAKYLVVSEENIEPVMYTKIKEIFESTNKWEYGFQFPAIDYINKDKIDILFETKVIRISNTISSNNKLYREFILDNKLESIDNHNDNDDKYNQVYEYLINNIKYKDDFLTIEYGYKNFINDIISEYGSSAFDFESLTEDIIDEIGCGKLLGDYDGIENIKDGYYIFRIK